MRRSTKRNFGKPDSCRLSSFQFEAAARLHRSHPRSRNDRIIALNFCRQRGSTLKPYVGAVVFSDERSFDLAGNERITIVTSGAVAVGPNIQDEMTDRAERHFRVMRVVEQNPTMSQRDLARALGVSLGGINYCINALITKGAINVEKFRASDNKNRYAYILTPRGITEKARMTGRILQRKIRQYEALKAEIDSLQIELGGTTTNDER